MTDSVRAYINHGRWVADCPVQYCGNAMRLEPRQGTFRCRTRSGDGCGHEAQIEWPADADEIWRVLERRPIPGTRNWFPPEHPLAVRAGCPHGQTPADLLAENEEHGVKGMR